MSNLLKQYFIVPQTQETETVVIDSNSRVKEKIREAYADQGVDSEDGFQLGLDAAEIVPEDPEQILNSAKAEAEEILSSARAKAEEIINEANANAEEAFQKQSQAGYEEGMQRAQQELENTKAQLQEDYQKQIDEYYADYEKEFMRPEPDLIDVIIQVVDHVFSVEFEDRRDLILSLVDSTMHGVESAKEFHIKVADQNRSFLEDHLEELRGRLPDGVEVDVSGDASLAQDGCRIETEHGVYDCSVDVELDNLYRNIRLLCGK